MTEFDFHISPAEVSDFEFKSNVETAGELLWNFTEAQLHKIYLNHQSDPLLFLRYRFVVRHILPVVGYHMEKIILKTASVL